jgi:phosphatidylserine synthase
MNNSKNILFLWPNVISFTALLMAWLAIVILLQEKFYLSFALILVAFIFDSADGYLARKLNQVSDFGRQLDSKVDIFIYLVYPAITFYQFFKLDDPFSILIIFVFLASGIFRLVRFNCIGYVSGFNYPGLPVIFSHLLVLIFLLFKEINLPYFVYLANFLILGTSALMLCTFPFPKPKKISKGVVLLLILIFIMLYLHFYGNN